MATCGRTTRQRSYYEAWAASECRGCGPTAECQNYVPLMPVAETRPKPRWPKPKPARKSC